MARITAVKTAVVIDTSWLVELYRVPGHCHQSRSSAVRAELGDVIEKGQRAWVPVPVLFELANHIAHVKDGNIRRDLSGRLASDIRQSIEHETPWLIPSVGRGTLLRTKELVHLADRFLRDSGPGYSLADISVIDLAEALRESDYQAQVLSFDDQLRAYSD